jgi:hypothetical protein
MYVREARRMISEYVMTQANCQQKLIAEDPVGLGAYNMDSHNVQRYVNKDGFVRNEGDIQVGVSPYRVSYRSIRPKKEHCENLLVPVCLAASHIAYGSIRMEPVFMVLGQSAATAACQAIDNKQAVQDIEYSALKERLLADGQVLEWTGPLKASTTAIDAKSLEGVVVDNTDAKLTGNWVSSASVGGFVGIDYIHDGNANKGDLAAAYIAKLPHPGLYEVRVYYTPNPNRATNVPVTIHANGAEKTIHVNERQAPKVGKYAPLGTFNFGTGAMVTISNRETDGYVVIDAVQFVPVNAEDARGATKK